MRLLLKAVAVRLDGAVGGGGVTAGALAVVGDGLALPAVLVWARAVVGVHAEVLVVAVEVVEDAVAGFGSKEPLAPLGSPSKLRLTWPVKPPVALIMTL